MALVSSGRRRPALPARVRAAVAARRSRAGARLGASTDVSGVTSSRPPTTCAVVDADGTLVWRRPWHEAEAGTWSGEDGPLTVTWVDRERPARSAAPTEPSLLQQTLRERVQASVVLADEFRSTGQPAHGAGRRSARTSPPAPCSSQAIPGRGADLTDPRVAREAAAERLARLRAEVGLD